MIWVEHMDQVVDAALLAGATVRPRRRVRHAA